MELGKSKDWVIYNKMLYMKISGLDISRNVGHSVHTNASNIIDLSIRRMRFIIKL